MKRAKELGAVVDELREIMEKRDCGASSLSSMYLVHTAPAIHAGRTSAKLAAGSVAPSLRRRTPDA